GRILVDWRGPGAAGSRPRQPVSGDDGTSLLGVCEDVCASGEPCGREVLSRGDQFDEPPGLLWRQWRAGARARIYIRDGGGERSGTEKGNTAGAGGDVAGERRGGCASLPERVVGAFQRADGRRVFLDAHGRAVSRNHGET